MDEIEELKDQISKLYGIVTAQNHLLISLVTNSNNIDSILADFDEIHKSNINEMNFWAFTDKEIEYLKDYHKILGDYAKKINSLK